MASRPVLFVDPGPNLVQYLAAAGERLAPEYRAVFFARRVKSRSILHRLGRELHPRGGTGRANGYPDSIRLDRESLIGRLRRHADRELVRHEGPVFCWLVNELHACIERLDPAALFFWNGSGLAAAIAEQLARPRGIPCLYAENGYLPGTLQLDREGVNAFSSIGRTLDLERIRSLEYSSGQLQEFDRVLAQYRRGDRPGRQPPAGGRVRPSPLAYFLQALEDWRERSPSVDGNHLIPRELPQLPERFVFFPLQVRSDSQLTIHSPLYGNRLDEAVGDVVQALEKIDPALQLVVKLHPADLDKTDYDPLVRMLPQVLWLAGGDVRPLLAHASAVVTVNSTVGIEAMIYDKPVVTLGHNFYVHPELTQPVRTREELPACLAEVLDTQPDHELIMQFLRYLYFHAFVRAHWRDHSAASLDHLAHRICAEIREAQACLNDSGSGSRL